jgi:hypothetical protein
MSYYILPKINNNLNVNPSWDDDKCSVYCSFSLYNYYNNIKSQIDSICLNEPDLVYNYNELIKIVNPYEYVFFTVPGSKYSVSKLKPTTSLFYDFLEIITTLDIFEQFKHISSMDTLHITENYNDINECFEMLRENFSDNIVFFNKVSDENIKLIHDKKFHFLFFETRNNNLNNYFFMLIEYVGIILRNIKIGGTCIIKIDQTFHKPVIDILYFLSSLFEKVYILKPNTSNITSFEKYIICKEFHINEINLKQLKMNYYRIIVFLKKLENKNILSLFNINLPYYFTTKINDINNIIGQQQLEALNLIINILKNKNKDDKIELLQKSNIQKSVAWCEKYKIPCNKFFEKTNIFLPIIKEQKDQNKDLLSTSSMEIQTENL